MKFVEQNITAPKGFYASSVHSGIKKSKKDLSLITSETACTAAGAFTQNLVKAAPVLISQQHLHNEISGIIINSGNANACTSEQGMKDALTMCEDTAKHLNVQKENILVASTGVIGVPLPMEKIRNGIPLLVQQLKSKDTSCSEGIMTTDTFPKEIALEFEIDGTVACIGAIAKGSGMIHPNMATMLGFITTDVCIDGELLQTALSEVVSKSFNMISVDGDTSTNDMVLILSNGMAGNKMIQETDQHYAKFFKALETVCIALAKMIAKDGEGATKLLESTVLQAENEETAKKIAKSIISSSLTKAAFFGEDANWGRILCAAGYSGAHFDPNIPSIELKSEFGSILVFEKGTPLSFDEDIAKKILSAKEITIIFDLHEGNVSATAWGCDLTYDYVKINGDYRS